jgi:hypothetical protein
MERWCRAAALSRRSDEAPANRGRFVLSRTVRECAWLNTAPLETVLSRASECSWQPDDAMKERTSAPRVLVPATSALDMHRTGRWWCGVSLARCARAWVH